jgi:hypothetical protein
MFMCVCVYLLEAWALTSGLATGFDPDDQDDTPQVCELMYL